MIQNKEHLTQQGVTKRGGNICKTTETLLQ